jgi:hypothetical protein
MVGVFGTPEASGSGRYIRGDTALEAAQFLLGHVWPVDLAEFNKRDDPGKWRYKHEARTGIAGHRITVSVDDSNRWSVGYDRPVPEPLTVTVADLRLAAVRAEVAALVDAQAKLKALTEQVRRARDDVRHFKYRVGAAAEEATRSGVAVPDVTKAGRPPRRSRKKSEEQG